MRTLLLAGLLAAFVSLPGAAQPSALIAPPATLGQADPPRAATVLALAPPEPLPDHVADLAAPLPIEATAPLAPTDGLETTRVILGIAAAAVALAGAIIALKK